MLRTFAYHGPSAVIPSSKDGRSLAGRTAFDSSRCSRVSPRVHHLPSSRPGKRSRPSASSAVATRVVDVTQRDIGRASRLVATSARRVTARFQEEAHDPQVPRAADAARREPRRTPPREAGRGVVRRRGDQYRKIEIRARRASALSSTARCWSVPEHEKTGPSGEAPSRIPGSDACFPADACTISDSGIMRMRTGTSHAVRPISSVTVEPDDSRHGLVWPFDAACAPSWTCVCSRDNTSPASWPCFSRAVSSKAPFVASIRRVSE